MSIIMTQTLSFVTPTNGVYIISKLEFGGWTTDQINEQIDLAKEAGRTEISIEGDDADVPFGDDSLLESLGFTSNSKCLEGRKIWKKQL